MLSIAWQQPAPAGISQQQRVSIDAILRAHGSYVSEEGVYKLSFTRDDLRVRMRQAQVVPRKAISAWVAFAAGTHHEAAVTGQFVLLEDEVNPTLTAALDGGLHVVGLGSSLLFERPR